MFSYKKYADLRDSKGVTDYRVSKNTGVPTSTLSNWKAGRYTPKSDKIKAIADYFGVPMEYFLEGKKEKEPTLNDIRKENGLKPIPEGDAILTKA